MGFDAEKDLLQAMGLQVEIPDAGCCGMAGSFGYEAGERYQVSIQAGERVLLPAVRAAAPDTLIVADGFSCRGQIASGTHRRALHLAQVLQMALGDGREAPPPPSALRFPNSTAELFGRLRTALLLSSGGGEHSRTAT
jgi:Fe-S oxidoreductase